MAGNKKGEVMKVISSEQISHNVYRIITESEKYGVVSQTVLMMPEAEMNNYLDGAKDLKEYICNNPPKGFKPIPHRSDIGNFIEWFWKDEDHYAEPVYHNGKWMGTVYRSFKTKEVIGVQIHLESVSEVNS